ncbi:MAG: NAD-glutamate dehydrogenase [Gammaproteobacteria bacterium]|nr:NAD-glutamate dehydrogenase [Gammaproteobacteria bacterium]
MAKHAHSSRKSILNKIIAYAHQQLEPGRATDLLCRFIKLFYIHSPYLDIRDRPIVELYSIAVSHWQLMQQREPCDFTLKVFNPTVEKDGWQSTHTIIQLIIKDMPFVIDSMRMELGQLGLTIHLMIHMGGMKVIRDPDNNLLDLSTYHSRRRGEIEAPIYMEIDRQTDPQFLQTITDNLKRVLGDVRMAIEDWPSMQTKMREAASWLTTANYQQSPAVISESKAFLEWLLSNHFTFLGVRDYELVGSASDPALKLVPNSGLGVLRDTAHSRMYRHFSELPVQARELALSKDQILIISKTNTRSTVHRPTYTDYIGVKRFDENGELKGERRFIGLYTSAAYNESPRSIPFLREKVQAILKKSALPEKSHDGKDLTHILATLPRDDLFQATEQELFEISTGILHLQERLQIRLFVRHDAYQRFISCLVYVPRENFNADLLNRMARILKRNFQGIDISYETQFSASVLARIYFVVRIDPRNKLKYDVEEVERELVQAGKSWSDGLRESLLDYFGEERGNHLILKYRSAFSAAYREAFSPHSAVHDVEHIEKLSSDIELGMSFFRLPEDAEHIIRFKLFHLNETVPLSDALPILENMGLRVIGEQPYQLVLPPEQEVWINDFSMTYQKNADFEVEAVKEIFQETFRKVWLGEAENDELNRLVLEAQLTYRQITVFRAYAKYLKQIGFTFSLQYIAETLVNNPDISRILVDIFNYRFDPAKQTNSAANSASLEESFFKLLDSVAILDEDRILRRLLALIKATLRTNYFQLDAGGSSKTFLALKLDPKQISDMPKPMPTYEVFVYASYFEGVHLRMAKVARGGIRWSDRREDFRTEILGLMKAQQVKNALIVPSGAKGGFVLKRLPGDAPREVILNTAQTCYRNFIQGLLDITDNLIADEVAKPVDVVCYDDDDPYLVVAADKGTATFSDIANQIALEYGYWLGDAFASGGSTGYDHKKMGITARGAWVSAERHFQELAINVDSAEIKVVGIGDMSGDVFGNGLLLSQHIKLVAAFNHMHIFLDPNPDPELSFKERQRLFDLPRSSWMDYDAEYISNGGGVYLRSAKSIKLSAEVQALLKIKQAALDPNELIKAILRAPVDLIWNGGIGTYIKSSAETNLHVGDRANDAVRVSGNEIKAQVICEGGNLGLTQLGRIECEAAGCKLNTDFIDNSAGVDCSDHEVNIKILLNQVVSNSILTQQERNELLARMTDEVANLVLQNNYHQNQAISLAEHLSPRYLGLYIRYLGMLEQDNKIDRELEFLPDKKTLLTRKAEGQGLKRPELAVLFAYSKILLGDYIRHSDLPEDEYLAEFIQDAFPTPLRRHYQVELDQHHLRREIISTQISNQLVSDMGITFTYQMQDETGAPLSAVVRAYAAMQEIFNLNELYADIEALDYKVEAMVQLQMMQEVVSLVRRSVRWLLRNRRHKIDIQNTINDFSDPIAGLFKRLPDLLLGDDRRKFEEYRDELVANNVPPDVALKVATAQPLYQVLNIIESSQQNNTDVYYVAKIYFILVERLKLSWFREQINNYPADNHWSVLARAAYKGDLDWIQRSLTLGVLNAEVKVDSVSAKVDAWFEQHTGLIERWQRIIADIRSTEAKEFALLSVAIRELSDLAQASEHHRNLPE